MTTLLFFKANYRFLMFGLLLTLFSSLGQSFFYGLFKEDMRVSFGVTNTSFGSIYGLINVASALCLMRVGRAIDHLPLQKFTTLSFLVLGAGCIIMSFAFAFPVFIAALFFTRFGGQGLFIHTNATSMGRYYHETRGRALAITMLGLHFGGLTLPIIVVTLKKYLEWQQCWLVFAALLLFVIYPLARWLLKGHNERHENWEKEEVERSKQTQDQGLVIVDEWAASHLLKDIRFYLMIPALLINPIICTGLFFYIQNVAEAKDWTMHTIALSFSANALATMVCTLIGGGLVDKISAQRMLLFLPAPMILALTILGTVSAPVAAFAVMILIGMSVGIFSATSGSIWAELYGTKHLGSIRSLFAMVMVLSTALMPPLMGYFFDRQVTIEALSFGLIGYVVFAYLLSTPISISAWRKQLAR